VDAIGRTAVGAAAGDDGLRRETAVGDVITPAVRAGLAAAFLAIGMIGVWNAVRYPVMLGFDAAEHTAYADKLLDDFSLPTKAEGGEYYTPPGFYAIAAVATAVGRGLGGESPDTYKPMQFVNVLFVLGTAALLLRLARTLFPRRPWLWVAALGFFAFVPLVAKTAAMFHPETLNMLVATATLALAAEMIVERRFDRRHFLLLGTLVSAGQLVRASSLFVIAAVVVTLCIALALPENRPRIPFRSIAVSVGVLVALVLPWSAWQMANGNHPIIGIPDTQLLFHPVAPVQRGYAPFFGLALHDVFTRPYRPQYANEALPETYTELWGDWTGVYSWSSYSGAPWPPALELMRDQSWIGVVPTALAIAGWFGLVWIGLRRGRNGVAFLPLLILPVVAIAAYLYRGYAYAAPDGTLLKALYLLNTVPAWALGFGLAVDGLRRLPGLRWFLPLALIALAFLEIRFVLYGIRDHVRIL
jgi:hypothetical protein